MRGDAKAKGIFEDLEVLEKGAKAKLGGIILDQMCARLKNRYTRKYL
ncbi:MAG: hypothetical protein ACE5GD_06655 [Candidatus Geothermarchaeales archaeon]